MKFKESGALLQTDFADDLPSVSADRVQLQQVILNLLLNATEAMIRGRGSAEGAPGKDRQLNDDGSVRLSVRDSGVGLDPHLARKVVRAFYTTKADGMGIGLHNLPFDHREPQGTSVGNGQRRTGGNIQFLYSDRFPRPVAPRNAARSDRGGLR